MFCQARMKWAALPILIFAGQAVWHAGSKSPTYDEPGHLTVSWLLGKTDHADYDVSHPPLIRKLFAFPLLFLNPSLPSLTLPVVPESASLPERPPSFLYVYANAFIFTNRVPLDTLIFSARLISILLGCVLAFWVFLWSSKLYGARAGLFSLWIFAFCPNLIANGSLVATDMGGIAFAVGFLYFFSRLLEKSGPKALILTGLFLGLALLSKYTNLILAPLFVLFYIAHEKIHKVRIQQILKRISAVAAVSWFTVCLGYQFDRVFVAHTLQESDWEALKWREPVKTIYRLAPLPDAFLRGIACGAHHNRRGHASFFKGQYSNGGWKAYFPTAFLVKTPAVTILLLLAWILLRFFKERRFSAQELLIILPALLALGTAVAANINIGLRHILLVYPLLAILLGRIFAENFFATKKGLWIGSGLILGIALEVLSQAPDYLAFFNRPSGGPEKGIQYFSDSNIDWGQDLKGLAKYLKEEGDPEVMLSYFGTAVPQSYGIRFQGLPTVWAYPKSEHVNSLDPKRELCAVSVTNLQGTYFAKHDLYAWLLKREPVKKIGHSIHVYDVTADAEAHSAFAQIYAMTGEKEKFMREMERAKRSGVK